MYEIGVIPLDQQGAGPREGIEPSTARYQPTILPLNYLGTIGAGWRTRTSEGFPAVYKTAAVAAEPILRIFLPRPAFKLL